MLEMLSLGAAAFSQPTPCPLMFEGLRIIFSSKKSVFFSVAYMILLLYDSLKILDSHLFNSRWF